MEQKLRKLYPKKLLPPPEVIIKWREREKNKVSSNPIVRFFKTFFGEGY